MDAYISKPVTQAALETTLSELFHPDSASVAGAPAEKTASPEPRSSPTAPESSNAKDQPAPLQPGADVIVPVRSTPPPVPAARPSQPEVNPSPNIAETFPIEATASTNGASAKGAPLLSGEPTKNSRPVCDRATLDELRAEGDGLLPELVGIFQTELTKGLDELTRALETRDCPAVARIAHTLKGTAGTFGATRMHELAATIDYAAREGNGEQAAAMFDEFRAECERVRTYLTAEVAA